MSVPNVNCKIKYIQNEEDLAKSSVLTEKYGGNRQFYSSRLADDYMKYMDKGSKEKTDYISYAGDEEKSCGVFDKNGLLTSRGKQKLRQNLRKTKSIIWDCLLTFQPEFGQWYCNDYEQAYEMMKREMPRFLKDAGFKPDNITWFAALHTNKKHRHIHISFFENAPTRIRQRSKELQFSHGKINQECIRRFKVHVEQNLTDISAELRIARKEATTLSKEVLFSKDSLIRYNNAFQEQILDLADKLPPRGRISYDSENMRPLRPLIDKIVDTAIKSNRKWYKAFVNFCAEAKKHDDRTREILIRPPADTRSVLAAIHEIGHLFGRYVPTFRQPSIELCPHLPPPRTPRERTACPQTHPSKNRHERACQRYGNAGGPASRFHVLL